MEASAGAGSCTEFGSNTRDLESASALEAGREPVPALRPEAGPASAPERENQASWLHLCLPSAPTTDLQPQQLQPQSSLTCPGSKFFLLFSYMSSLVLYFMCSNSNSMTISPATILNCTVQQH